MGTPPPPRLLDTNGKLFASPSASIRSLSQLLEDDRRTPLATAFSSRPQSRVGTAGASAAAAAAAGGLTAAGLSVVRGGASPLPQAQAQHPQVAQGLLAAKESEAALLRQQLHQLTADFKFNLKLLEERDAELERVDAVVAGLREAAGSREAALGEARRSLSAKESALREKEARVAVLEERQKQLVELCERQVSDARAARDEEVARARQNAAAAHGDAARDKAEVIASYERQFTAAAAAEREARQRATAAAEETEHVRSQLSRAEARVAEQELSMQRMVSQFEGALSTLQQLEAQYEGLAADAGAADRLRAARIEELEREAAALRGARGGLQQERDALASALAAAEAAATEAKQQYHRAMMDAAELTEALAGARAEAAGASSRAAVAEEELQSVQSAAAQAQAALEREVCSHARTQGLLESTRMHQEAARRDAQEQEALAAQLREAAAVLEAERNDYAQAAEAAQAKLQAAEERAALLAEQVEQEGRLRAQLLEAREAELVGRWERALEAAQDERATLQQALDLANRQLQQAHRDMETLRLQFQHLQLGSSGHGAAAAAAPEALEAAAAVVRQGLAGGAAAFASPGYTGSTRSSGGGGGGYQAGTASGGRQHTAAAPGSLAGGEHSVQEAASPAGSRDVFSDDPDHVPFGPSLRQRQLQQHDAEQQEQQPLSSAATAAGGGGGGAAPASSAYQQQLYRHIDTLASKLSSFQRAVDDARQAGHQASRQLAQSSSMLPADLQRRQAAVAVAADQQLQAALAAERQQFEEERRQLDRQLAQQQAELAEREAELTRLQRAEGERRQQQQQEQQQREWNRKQQQQQREREQEEQRWQQQREQQQQQQQLQQGQSREEAAFGSRYADQAPALGHRWQHQQLLQQAPPRLDALRASQEPARLPPRQFGGVAASLDLPVLRLDPSASGGAAFGGPQQQQQRRSVSAALAAVGRSPAAVHSAAPPGASYASSHHASPSPVGPLPLPRANGSSYVGATGLAPAGGGSSPSSRAAPLRAAATSLGAMPQLAAAQAQPVPVAAAGGEDPLSRARRQVLAAKSYLRQVADMGGRLAQDGATGS